MRDLRYRSIAVLTAAMVALASSVVPATAQDDKSKWGTIKGQLVFAGDNVPAPAVANVDKDKAHCLEKGPILKGDLIVNKSNKGVRWALVWLADPSDATNAKWKPKAIHPSIKVKETVEVDQPRCAFEPRVVGLVAGQQMLVVKNSSPIPHNSAITSVGDGPNVNPLIAAGGKVDVKGFVPKLIPTRYSCSIHAWMEGWVGTFAHPYFVVTDENGNFELKNVPAGKNRVMIWHEKAGWVFPAKQKEDRGKVVSVKGGETLDMGKVPLKVD